MAIKPYEVTTSKIATKSVTSEKIADRAIETRHIKDGAVTPEKLSVTLAGRPLTPPVDTTEIKDGAVTTAKIAGNAVTNDKLAPNAVNADKIADGVITTAKIANGAITRDKVADRSVGTADLVDGAVTNPKIAANAVTQGKIAANSVGSSEIIDGAVGARELSTDAVETAKIKDGAVTPSKLSFTPASRPLSPRIATDEIGDAQVTPAKLAQYAVTFPKIDAENDPAPGKVLGVNVAGTRFKYSDVAMRPLTPPVTTGEIEDAAVTSDKIGDQQVKNNNIELETISQELLYRIAAPNDGQILAYDQATGKFKWIDPPTGGSKVTLINPQTVFDETATSDRSAPLSVATVIPATAVGVLVELHQDGMVPSWAQPSTQIQHQLGGVALTVYITGNAAGNMPMYNDNAGLVPIYASQQIYLVINRVGVSTRVKVTITGYIE